MKTVFKKGMAYLLVVMVACGLFAAVSFAAEIQTKTEDVITEEEVTETVYEDGQEAVTDESDAENVIAEDETESAEDVAEEEPSADSGEEVTSGENAAQNDEKVQETESTENLEETETTEEESIEAAEEKSTQKANTNKAKAPAKAPASSVKLSIPGGLKAYSQNSSIRITWNKVEGAESYIVYYRESGTSKYNEAATVKGTAYDFKNVSDGKVYDFKVAAAKGSSTSSQSGAISSVYLKNPVLVSAKSYGSGIEIKWKAVKGAKGYKVYRKRGPGDWKILGNTTSTSFKDSKSPAGVNCTYTVRAFIKDGDRKNFSWYDANGKTAIKLSKPAGVKTSYKGGRNVTVSWNKVKGAKSYDVYRYFFSKKKYIKIGTSKTNSYAFKSEGPGYVHRFKVIARSGGVASVMSSGDATVVCLLAPKLKSASVVGNGIKVTWNKVSGASGYRVYRKTANSNWKSLGTTKSTSFTDQTVADKTKYTYTVRAYTMITKKAEYGYYDAKGKTVTSKVTTLRGKMLAKAQNYSSKTKYLILVNCGSNRVGVYEGSKGKWKEKFFWYCSTGTAATPTVKGNFQINFKRYTFGNWNYSVYYTSSFYGPYYLHSILYHAGTWNVMDGRLGMDLSHGCVRLAADNAKWIYNVAPVGTAVITY